MDAFVPKPLAPEALIDIRRRAEAMAEEDRKRTPGGAQE